MGPSAVNTAGCAGPLWPVVFGAALIGLAIGPVQAADLYRAETQGLAVDRVARKPGDSITILILENSTAANSARNGAKRSSRYAGRIGFGTSFDKSAQLALDNDFDGDSQTRRSGQMVGQISATITGVLPNGDFTITGTQLLHINNERTKIGVRGRIRPVDIGADNTILSSRIADAQIEYDGRGFVTRGAKPGLISRVFAWLGLS